jgi:hypothetical protein
MLIIDFYTVNYTRVLRPLRSCMPRSHFDSSCVPRSRFDSSCVPRSRFDSSCVLRSRFDLEKFRKKNWTLLM